MPARVPATDATTNRLITQVIGSKSDAAQTTVGTTRSLMAYIKGILNQTVSISGGLTDAGVQVVGTTSSAMSYIKGILDQLSGAAGITTWPAAAAPANAVSLAEAIRYIVETQLAVLMAEISGAAGIVTWPSAAAPANAVSIAEAIRYIVEGQLTVVGADSTNNVDAADVIGNKTDAGVQAIAADKSAVGYLKGILDILTGTAGITTWPAAAAPANAVSLAEAIRYIVETQLAVLMAEISGAAGIVTWPAAAAPANAVSIAEAIRYIVETQLAVLMAEISGAAGIVTWPAAAAPADAVSLAEAIRYIVEGQLTVVAADSTNNVDAADVIGNKTDAATNAVAADKSQVAYLKALIAGSATGVGSLFVIYKQITKTALDTATPVDVTGVSTTGLIEIVDSMIQNDATNMGGGTLVELYTNNVEGLNAFLSSAIANWDSGGVVTGAKKVVLETGKKVIVRVTGADLTGAGTFGIYLVCKRLAAGASLAAA